MKITFENSLGSGVMRISRTTTAALLGLLAFAVTPAVAQDLFVTDTFDDGVYRFDGSTGDLLGTFSEIPLGRGSIGMVCNPRGNLLVSEQWADKIEEFDGTTGAFVREFASGSPLSCPTWLVYGPNGNLFVSNSCDGNILEFEGDTGTFVRVFASGGGLAAGPFGLGFAPNGKLYVASGHYSFSTNGIVEVDAETGDVLGMFAHLNQPRGLIFGANGHMYVSDIPTASVKEFDVDTGSLVREFTGGLISPHGLAFGPNGNLFVAYTGGFSAPPGSGEVIEFDSDTGARVGAFVPAGFVKSINLLFGTAGGACCPASLSVDIDIKPGSCPNPLNVRSRGIIPIALAGDAEFDVLEVDTSSLRLEGVRPLRVRVEDVAAPFDGEPCNCHPATADGISDLSLTFGTEEVVAALGQVTDREERPLTLTGTLLDGTPFAGTDCVRILAGGGGPPDTPLVSEDPGALELSLTWEPSDSPYFLAYAIYRGTASGFLPANAQDFHALTTDLTFLDTQVNAGETWFYRLGVFDEPVIIETPEGAITVEVFSGYSEVSGLQIQTSAPTIGGISSAVTLQRPRPNPISRTAQIAYALPSRMRVRLSVYDVTGRLVDLLVHRVEAPGDHLVHWDAGRLPSGTYFCRLEAGSEVRTERAILVR